MSNWQLASVDYGVKINFQAEDNGIISGTISYHDKVFNISGAWSASGSVTGRKASVFSVYGSDGEVATNWISASGIMVGPGTAPDHIEIQMGVSSSGDGSLNHYSALLFPDQADTPWSPLTTAHAYTTIASPNQSSPAATLSNALDVNFSAQAQNGAMSNFTVGGWVRLTNSISNAPTQLFSAPGQFTLAATANGELSCQFGPASGGANLTSKRVITDTEWHYVAVACEQASASSPASVQIVFDGLVAAKQDVQYTAVASAAQPCTIGGGVSELVSWTIWGVALPKAQLFVPEFGPPSANSVTFHNVVAAFNFANGTNKDQSGNNVAITANPGPSYLPRLSLSSGSVLQPAPQDNVQVFGSTCSWMGWVQLPNAQSDNLTLFANDNASVKLTLFNSNQDGTSNYQFVMNGSAIEFKEQTGSYAHIAVVVEIQKGSSMMFTYVNGVPSQTGIGSGVVLPGGLAKIGLINGATSALQGVSVWNRAIEKEEVHANMQGSDPTGTPGLVAYYSLQHDLVNSVTGRAATTSNASLKDVVEDEQVHQQVRTSLATAPVIRKGLESHRIDFRAQDIESLAKEHGIVVNDDYIQHIKKAHQTLMESMSAHAAAPASSELSKQLLNSLILSEKLRAAGVKHGELHVEKEGEHTVVYFHDEQGKHEIHRIEEALDPFTTWLLTIIVDVIAVLGGIFGLATTSDQLKRVVQVIAIVLPTIKNAILDGFNGKHTSPADAVFSVIKEIYSAGILLTVIKGLVTGSWWSLIFTALSVLGQIVALIVSGGALIAVKIGQVGVGLVKLLYDISQYPSSPELENS